MIYTITYSNIHETEQNIIGTRALYLGKVFDKNVNSCLFFVVTNNSFKEFCEHNSVFSKIAELSHLEDTVFWVELKKFFSMCTFPSVVKDEIKESYDALSVSDSAANTILRSFDARVNVFISSGDDVDLEGLFLNIKGFDNLLGAIKSSWFSFLHRHNRDDLQSSNFDFPGVVVEKFVVPSFSVEVEVSDDNMLNLFAYKGLPEVSKGIVKDSYNLSFNHLEFLNYELNYQNFKILHQDESGVLLKKRLGREGADDKASKALISECARLAKRVFNTLEVPVKVVFVVKQDTPHLFLIESLIKKEEDNVDVIQGSRDNMFLDKSKLDVIEENGSLDSQSLSDSSMYEHDIQGENAYGSEPDVVAGTSEVQESSGFEVLDEDVESDDEIFSDSDEFIIQGEDPVIENKEDDLLSSFFKLVDLLEEDLHRSYIESFGFEPDSFKDAVIELESKHGFDSKQDILRVLEVKSLIVSGKEFESDVIVSLINIIDDFLKRSAKC